MKKTTALLLGIACALLTSCEPPKRHHAVKTYRTHSTMSNEDMLFWYVIFNSTDGTYSYASSPSRTTSYSNLTWTSGARELPTQLATPTNTVVEEEPEVEVDVEELPSEVAEDVAVDSESDFGDSSADDSGGDFGDSGGDSGGDCGGDGGGGE